jgi:hypothetical protein
LGADRPLAEENEEVVAGLRPALLVLADWEVFAPGERGVVLAEVCLLADLPVPVVLFVPEDVRWLVELALVVLFF